jgi:hypothetical protein
LVRKLGPIALAAGIVLALALQLAVLWVAVSPVAGIEGSGHQAGIQGSGTPVAGIQGTGK